MDNKDGKNCGTLRVCVRDPNDVEGRLRIKAHVRVFEEAYGSTSSEDELPVDGTSARKRRQKTPDQVYPSRDDREVRTGMTRDSDGCVDFTDLEGGVSYYATASVGPLTSLKSGPRQIKPGACESLTCNLDTGFSIGTWVPHENCLPIECDDVDKGRSVMVQVDLRMDMGRPDIEVVADFGNMIGRATESYHAPVDSQASAQDVAPSGPTFRRVMQLITPTAAGIQNVSASARYPNGSQIRADKELTVRENVQQVSGDISVTMRRTAAELTEDLPLWVVIRNSTNALSFNNYSAFLDQLFCGERAQGRSHSAEERHFRNGVRAFHNLAERRYLPYTDSDAYRVLKVATEAFVMVNCGVFLSSYPFSDEDQEYVLRKIGIAPDLTPFWRRYLESVNGWQDSTLPYLALVRQKLRDVSVKTHLFDNPKMLPPKEFEECSGILADKLTSPCMLELIWSYWHEEGMLVQTLNAVTRRFQNVRVSAPGLDPLANFEVDPLRPLGNLIWAYTQDEQHRLSVMRRNHEYIHEYGLRLEGKAVGDLPVAESRSKFLEAFHHLLHLAAQFYKQDDNTTIVADGFPVLNALKEVHLILAEGAHNQFGDLPSTARIEMLMQQWLLARPEFREFLPTRVMVAYPEAWMDRVDAMKRLQGWSDTNVLNFRNLGVFGEQLLLTIRYGNWNDVHDAAHGANWARFWRPEVQGYVHAYRAVSGVDHSVIAGDARVDATLPSTLLRRRLTAQLQQQRT